jgi:hypothetical protein
MLEFCRAIIFAPTRFDSPALAEVAAEVGFGDVASIFEDSESNGLSYPVSYFPRSPPPRRHGLCRYHRRGAPHRPQGAVLL